MSEFFGPKIQEEQIQLTNMDLTEPFMNKQQEISPIGEPQGGTRTRIQASSSDSSIRKLVVTPGT